MSRPVAVVDPITGSTLGYTKSKRIFLRRHAIVKSRSDGQTMVTVTEIGARYREQVLVDLEAEANFGAIRGGVLFWNGKDRRSSTMHKPGEVVS